VTERSGRDHKSVAVETVNHVHSF